MGELLRLGVFEEEPGGAAPQRSHDVFVGVEGREHGDGGRLGEVTEKPQQGQSVHVGHANVQQDNIGVRGRHDVERIFPRRGSHDAKVIGGVEDHRETVRTSASSSTITTSIMFSPCRTHLNARTLPSLSGP